MVTEEVPETYRVRARGTATIVSVLNCPIGRCHPSCVEPSLHLAISESLLAW